MHCIRPTGQEFWSKAAAGQSNGDHGVHRTPAGPAAVLRGCHAPDQALVTGPAISGGILLGVIELDRIKRINVSPPPAHAPADQDPQWLDSPGPLRWLRSPVCVDATGAIPGLTPWELEPACLREARCAHSQRTTPGRTGEQSEPAEGWNEKTTPKHANQVPILLKTAQHRHAAAAARSKGPTPTARSSRSTADATGNLPFQAGRRTAHHKQKQSDAPSRSMSPSA